MGRCNSETRSHGLVTRKALVTGASFGIFSDFSCSVNRLGIICDVDVTRGLCL